MLELAGPLTRDGPHTLHLLDTIPISSIASQRHHANGSCSQSRFSPFPTHRMVNRISLSFFFLLLSHSVFADNDNIFGSIQPLGWKNGGHDQIRFSVYAPLLQPNDPSKKIGPFSRRCSFETADRYFAYSYSMTLSPKHVREHDNTSGCRRRTLVLLFHSWLYTLRQSGAGLRIQSA
jgi:hypothetical protein